MWRRSFGNIVTNQTIRGVVNVVVTVARVVGGVVIVVIIVIVVIVIVVRGGRTCNRG